MIAWFKRKIRRRRLVGVVGDVEDVALSLAERDAKAAFPDEFIGTTVPPGVRRIAEQGYAGFVVAAADDLRRALEVRGTVMARMSTLEHARAAAADSDARASATEIARCTAEAAAGWSGRPDGGDRRLALLRAHGLSELGQLTTAAVLLVLAFAELPLLRLPFDLFDANLLETYGMVIGVQAAMLMGGHLFGRALRRFADGRTRWVMLFALASVIGTAAVTLGLLRADRLQFDIAKDNSSGIAIDSSAPQTSPPTQEPAADARTFVSERQAQWTFVAVQGVFVLIAVGLGYSGAGSAPSVTDLRVAAWRAARRRRVRREELDDAYEAYTKADANRAALAEELRSELIGYQARVRAAIEQYYGVIVRGSAAGTAAVLADQDWRKEPATRWLGERIDTLVPELVAALTATAVEAPVPGRTCVHMCPLQATT